ncbi:MAG: hypothetical protein CL844_06510 [Crocinitomicaceae bacterium]|nr:hypothetical protein [Crocinitomicaceae bacterium]
MEQVDDLADCKHARRWRLEVQLRVLVAAVAVGRDDDALSESEFDIPLHRGVADGAELHDDVEVKAGAVPSPLVAHLGGAVTARLDDRLLVGEEGALSALKVARCHGHADLAVVGEVEGCATSKRRRVAQSVKHRVHEVARDRGVAASVLGQVREVAAFHVLRCNLGGVEDLHVPIDARLQHGRVGLAPHLPDGQVGVAANVCVEHLSSVRESGARSCRECARCLRTLFFLDHKAWGLKNEIICKELKASTFLVT